MYRSPNSNLFTLKVARVNARLWCNATETSFPVLLLRVRWFRSYVECTPDRRVSRSRLLRGRVCFVPVPKNNTFVGPRVRIREASYAYNFIHNMCNISFSFSYQIFLRWTNRQFRVPNRSKSRYANHFVEFAKAVPLFAITKSNEVPRNRQSLRSRPLIRMPNATSKYPYALTMSSVFERRVVQPRIREKITVENLQHSPAPYVCVYAFGNE